MKILKLFNKEFFIHAFKFGIVGVVNTIICYITILLFYNVVHFSYDVSYALGYILGLVNSFLLNRSWTFKSDGNVKKELIKFMIVWVPCFIASYVVSKVMLEYMKISEYIATLAGNIVFTGMNFIGNKYFSFKNKV